MELPFCDLATATDLPGTAELQIEKRKEERAGAGSCSKCSCSSYESGGYGNDYCTCGHSYGDHW